MVKLEVQTGMHLEAMYLLVTHLAHTSILLGYPWFALHDAVIRPKAGTITFDSTYCNKHCQTDPTTLRLRSEETITKSMTPEVMLESSTVPRRTRPGSSAGNTYCPYYASPSIRPNQVRSD